MANGNFLVADIPGAVNRGLQFRQQEQLRPIQTESAGLALQQQKQGLQQGEQNLAVGRQNIETEAQRAKSQNLFNTVSRLRLLPDDQKLSFIQQNIAEVEARGGDASESRQAQSLIQQGKFTELNENLDNLHKVGVETGFLKAGKGTEQSAFESLVKGLPEDQQLEARLIKLGINPKAVGNADMTIAKSEELTDLVADSKAVIGERKKFGELTGSSRAQAIDKGFERIVKIDAGVRNIGRAIDVLNTGAGVGAIEKWLPSFRSASVELDNIQGSMALDVVGAVTFGALSKGELDLAKAVALPTGLDTPELITYLQKKKAAQEKLRTYFNDQVQHLDKGGTIASFLRSKEREAEAAAPAQQPAPATPPAGDLGGLSDEQLMQMLGQ